jgi:hypothetical protein
VCDGLGQPDSVTDALVMLGRALDHLAAADAASLPASVQAEALRALERAQSQHTAARARILAAFAGQGGFEDDGQGSARAWLKWQARVTQGAAAGAIGWARRVTAHPVIVEALAAGELSESWARQVCEWTGKLPESARGDAEEILTAAARGGAGLADLGGLAREMYERSYRDTGQAAVPGDGAAERYLALGVTFGGAGRLAGDLTPGCAAALSAVLEALGKRAGPEDLRTAAQRRHDALAEACTRLVRAGMVPGRAGQPTQILVHLTLAQLRGAPGGSAAEAAWLAARAAHPGWLSGPEAEAAACDATVVPVVTGHVDWAALDHLTGLYLALCDTAPAHTCPGHTGHDLSPAPGNRGAGPAARGPSPASGPHATPGTGPAGGGSSPADHGADPAARDIGPGGAVTGVGTGHTSNGTGCGCRCGGCHCPPRPPLSAATRARLRRALLALAADALSGPDGLAARLRAGLDRGPVTSISLPLDIGAGTETIPAHLRRAVTTRHGHCAFPGCDQPTSVCDIHHIVPRSRGGPTSLPNLVPLCGFHHLTAIHRWGWTLRLNGDGTTTATSPDRTRTLHSHGPPRPHPHPGQPRPAPPGRLRTASLGAPPRPPCPGEPGAGWCR